MTPEERRKALERITTYGELRLRCCACERLSEGRAEGWRGVLGAAEDDSTCVVVFCPDCALRELA
jgi:hypothetical protein